MYDRLYYSEQVFMPTPMVSFRLDPKLAAMMDARCQDLGQTRADWIRGLIVGEVGSPATESDSTDVQLAIATLGERVGGLDQQLDAMGEQFEGWVLRTLKTTETQLSNRIGAIEARLGQRR